MIFFRYVTESEDEEVTKDEKRSKRKPSSSPELSKSPKRSKKDSESFDENHPTAENQSSMEEEEPQENYPVQSDHQEFIPVNEFTPEYVNLLQKVQDRIANPRQDDNLESIVKLVQQTNCFAVDDDSIQFDLCLLDKRTVNKISKELGISVK